MKENGELREDLQLPSQTEEDQKISEQIRSDIEAEKELIVSVLAAMDDEKIVAVKTKTAA
jgi:translation initiation factor 5A